MFGRRKPAPVVVEPTPEPEPKQYPYIEVVQVTGYWLAWYHTAPNESEKAEHKEREEAIVTAVLKYAIKHKPAPNPADELQSFLRSRANFYRSRM